MQTDQLINTIDYSIPQLVIAGIGAVLWVAVYLLTLRYVRKHAFVEMPVFFACGNIVWEFLWGFVFYERINMGVLFVWSYRIWFIVDIFIFLSVLKYGYKQLTLEPLRKYAQLIFVALAAAFVFIISAFVNSELDNPMGAHTAYVLNLGISTTYILIYLRVGHQEYFSKNIAWCKMLGTLMYTIFFAMRFPEQSVVLVLGSIVFILDVIYIYFLYKYYGTNHPLLNLA